MASDEKKEPKLCVKKIKKLIEENLTIPAYQRPYKWQWQNVERLLKDVLEHQEKAEGEGKGSFRYRIGTIVIHKDEKLNIVDGQQRITTLALIMLAFANLESEGIKNKKINTGDKELDLTNFLENLKYAHTTSQKNICKNYKAIENFISDLENKKEEFKIFLLNNCEVVYIVLNDIDEAFQFFDSQNARGKSLEGYDLLKAFHLREMENNTEGEKLEAVQRWEKASNKKDEQKESELKSIFNDLLAIRKYSKGEKVGRAGFTKNDVDEFKGFNPLKHNYPYIKSYLMNDCFLKDNSNGWKNYSLLLTRRKEISYPFQITMQILNGKRFFEYVQFYIDLKEKLKKEKLKHFPKEYADQLFKRVLLFYYDKFGNNQIKEAIDYCYAWVYIIYKNLKSLRFRSIDNKGADGSNGKDKNGIKLFSIIRDALYHYQVIGLDVKNRLEGDYSKTKNEQNDKNLFEEIKE